MILEVESGHVCLSKYQPVWVSVAGCRYSVLELCSFWMDAVYHGEYGLVLLVGVLDLALMLVVAVAQSGCR